MSRLEDEISLYESQVAEVQAAISVLSDGEEKNKLIELEADLKEIIQLSKNSLHCQKEDPLLEEYNLFKSEIKELEENSENLCNSSAETSKCDVNSNDLREELNNLKGIKCQAPFIYQWTDDVTYHNAFISHIPDSYEGDSYEELKVKVMFTNPTHKEMLPCPYYLEGNCKFSDEKCRYSHGESVLLSSLKEYREPKFSELCLGCKILAKRSDELWYRAFIVQVNEDFCVVKFESNCKEEKIPFHNIFLLDSVNSENLSSDSCSSDQEESRSTYVEESIIKMVLENPPKSVLGEWEKYTKGFGSKMMAKMGYIFGSGLGRDGSGRTEPVSAVVLPPGKSLDHCMMLKEKAGNNKNLFKAERKLKLLQKKHEEKLKRAYENQKNKTDVFSFINKNLDLKTRNTSKVEVKKHLQNETTRNLNVTSLQVEDEMRKIQKEITSLKSSLGRQVAGSQAFKVVQEKLKFKENQFLTLFNAQRKIEQEKGVREIRKKLTVF